MIQTVIFDLGGVLIDWNPRYLYRQLFDDEARMEWFLETVCTQEWNEQQDAGRPIADAVAEAVGRWPEYDGLIRAYYDRWIEMVGGDLPETVAVLRALYEREVPLYALTNWSAETFPLVVHRFPFFRWFRDIVVSGKEGLKKPDPRLYRRLLDRHALSPQTTLFIDDNPANVAAAEELGMRGHHFTSAVYLRSDLAAHGLLPADGTRRGDQ